MLPLSPSDNNGWFLDPSTGDAVILFNGTIRHRLQKAGTTTLPGTVTVSTGDLTLTTGDLTLTAGDISATVASRTRKVRLPVGSWIPGATPPVAATVGTYRGYSFDADAEILNTSIEVPGDWTGAGDLTLKIPWMPESGAALADTETVKWVLTLRSKADTEVVDAGTAYTNSVTYTQSGAGTDKQQIISSITIDYDNTNQPIAAGDTLGIQLNRDFTTDTYASDGTVLDCWLEYPSTVLAVE
jgi:hypothetical protein